MTSHVASAANDLQSLNGGYVVIEPHHFEAGASVPPTPIPARNPRVGEFLKPLGPAEEWRTGLPRIYRATA